MTLLFILLLLGFIIIIWTRALFWITNLRMALRHKVTLIKIKLLKLLYENGFL